MTTDPAQGWLDRAGALLERRRVAEALAACGRAHRHGLDPARTARARWTCHMLLGDFAAAWAVGDAVLAAVPPDGFNRADLPLHLRQVWRGAPLAGRHVLVRCHHGLGDVLQFIRYVPPLRRLARSVAVMAEPRLFTLLRTVAGVDAVTPLGGPDPPFEVDIECMELAFAFRSLSATLPRGVPYLAAPAPAPASRGGRFRAGLVWSAGGWDGGHRSIPPALLAPLCRLPGIDWICLQRGDGLAGLRAEHGLSFAEPVDRHEDLARAAQRLRTLDLVVTVDTMIAHLAGALAVPVWTLLPFAADWRWMLGRSDTPWYPTMRLFRQPAAGDWRTPVQRIGHALSQPDIRHGQV